MGGVKFFHTNFKTIKKDRNNWVIAQNKQRFENKKIKNYNIGKYNLKIKTILKQLFFNRDKKRTKRIFNLALPIIGGMVSQNIINLVDIGMVGVLGTTSLAAVGMAGIMSFVSCALIMGVAVGVQATAARRKGEGNLDQMAYSLNTGIMLVVLSSPLLSALLYYLTPIIFPFLSNDPGVVKIGIPYLQWRILGIVFIGINFAFRGYWNGTDMSKLYMTALIIINLSNILLNYILIFGHFGAPTLGVTGAAIASVLAIIIGNFFYFFMGMKYASNNGFLRHWPRKSEIISLLKLSLPNGIQQLSFAAGYGVLYWIIGAVGTHELAAANVLINIMLIAMFPAMGFGIASATLVGQALGRKEVNEAYQWAFDVFKIGIFTLIIIGIPMWLFPTFILKFFIHNPQTLSIAILPLQIMGFGIMAEALIMIFMQSLLGAGDSKRVMYVTVPAHWLFFLPLVYIVGPTLGFGLLGIWIVQIVYRLLLGATLLILWSGKKWATIKI